MKLRIKTGKDIAEDRNPELTEAKRLRRQRNAHRMQGLPRSRETNDESKFTA